MKLKSDLSRSKKGDWVLTLQNGWAKITHVGKEWVSINDKDYTKEGRDSEDDRYSTCFPADQVPKPYLEIFGPPPCPFKRGDRVIVYDSPECAKGIRVFKRCVPGDDFPYRAFTLADGDEEGRYRYCEKWEMPDED